MHDVGAYRARWRDWPDPLRACLESILMQTGPALAARMAQTINDFCPPRGGRPPGTVDGLVTETPARPWRKETLVVQETPRVRGSIPLHR